MLSSEVSELILQNGKESLTYLILLAHAVKTDNYSFPFSEVEDFNDIEYRNINLLQKSGYINIVKEDIDHQIQLKKDGRFLIQEPEAEKKFERKEKEEYIPKGLTDLTEILGIPLDYKKNLGKYRKNYSRIKDLVSYEELLEVAKFAYTYVDDVDLNSFLTKSWFIKYKKMMKSPKKSPTNKTADRVLNEDYNADQPF